MNISSPPLSLMHIPLISYAIPSLNLILSPLDIEETFPLTYLNLTICKSQWHHLALSNEGSSEWIFLYLNKNSTVCHVGVVIAFLGVRWWRDSSLGKSSGLKLPRAHWVGTLTY